jgi:hypothetical protein
MAADRESAPAAAGVQQGEAGPELALEVTPCLPPLEGGMCGCDEPRDSGPCLSSECDC